jgi:hypothetical protein
MSSIVEKLNEINDIKNNIKQAIRDKGGEIPVFYLYLYLLYYGSRE